MTLNLLFFTLTLKWKEDTREEINLREKLKNQHEENIVRMLKQM